MQDLILRSNLCPGDHVMLTAAVRDLQNAHPGKYRVAVETGHPELWENNPHITKLAVGRVIDMEYPLVNGSNQRPYHFIHGYRMHLEKELGITIPAGPFKGDIHLTAQERSWLSQVSELEGQHTRFWIIVSGGKNDYTAKWWDADRWQAVVDHFKGRIRFVQVGAAKDPHPALRDVLDLRGKTSLRQLVRLMYHADGVLCPVTSLMHLAAAVPWKHGAGIRPCVVVAGGREPVQWEAYPGHRFLNTIGELPCCASGGCWKSRVVPLGDGDKKDESLCERPVKQENGVTLPACLDRITAADVIRAVEGYLAPVPDAVKQEAPPKKNCGGCGGGAGGTKGKPDQTDPAVWGPRLWRDFHGAIQNAPERFAHFLTGWIKAIPCEECKAHAKELLAKLPLPDKQETYKDWGIEFHNTVNQRLGKPTLNWKEAEAAILKNCGVPKPEQDRRGIACKACEHYQQATANTGPRCAYDGASLLPKLRRGECAVWEGKALAPKPVIPDPVPIGRKLVVPPPREVVDSTVGVVIGTYGAVPYIHLQLESLRRFHPETPCLVVDDGSPQREELAKLCAEYGAEFIGREQRMNHTRGDMQTFLDGHEWARQRGIGLLVKFSRRWIPIQPWKDDLVKLWQDTEAPTLSNVCHFHGFGFRSECVAMDVAKWSGGCMDHFKRDIERTSEQPPDLDCGKSGLLVEHIVHVAAAAAKGTWDGPLNFQPWPWMGTNRRDVPQGVLWHEGTPISDYSLLSRAWNLNYTASDLYAPEQNIHGCKSTADRKPVLGVITAVTRKDSKYLEKLKSSIEHLEPYFEVEFSAVEDPAKQMSIGKCWNQCVQKVSRAEWVCIMDDDNEFHPDFGKQLSEALKQTDADVILCDQFLPDQRPRENVNPPQLKWGYIDAAQIVAKTIVARAIPFEDSNAGPDGLWAAAIGSSGVVVSKLPIPTFYNFNAQPTHR